MKLLAGQAPAVATVNDRGLMKGDNSGNFRPADPITRQETAVLMDRVLQHTELGGRAGRVSRGIVSL
jgi:hypothetical protein